jgi:hypothetical protein
MISRTVVFPHLVTTRRGCLDEGAETAAAAMMRLPPEFRRLVPSRRTSTLDSGQAIVLQALADRDSKYHTSSVICNVVTNMRSHTTIRCGVELVTKHEISSYYNTLRSGTRNETNNPVGHAIAKFDRH